MAFADWKLRLAALFGDFNSSTDDVQDYVNRMAQVVRGWRKEQNDALASTATAQLAFHQVEEAATVLRARYLPDTTQPAGGGSARIIVRRVNSGGGGAVEITDELTVILSTNGFTSIDLPLNLTAANRVLSPGQLLTIEITKAGAGTILPSGCVEIVTVE